MEIPQCSGPLTHANRLHVILLFLMDPVAAAGQISSIHCCRSIALA
jgi:hypothetical protein